MSAAPLNIPADWPRQEIARGLLRPLSRLRWRCRTYLLVEGLFQLVLALVAAAAAQLLLDRWLRFSIDQRAVLNSVITLFWVWVIYRYVVLRLIQPLPDHVLAGWIDRSHPALHDQLSTAVEYAHLVRARSAGDDLDERAAAAVAGDSPQLVRAVVLGAVVEAGRVRFASVLNHGRAVRRALELGAILALVSAAMLQLPWMSVWFQRNWLLREIPWPQNTHLVPRGYDAADSRRMPRGEELLIEADCIGEKPREVEVVWSSRGASGREPMTLVGTDRFEATLGLLQDDVRFRLVGGDERTREYLVQAVEAPHVLTTRARVTPPAYVGAEPYVIDQQTVLELLAGSTLEIEARLNKQVTRVEFVGSEPVAGASAAPAVWSADQASPAARIVWESPASGIYRIELTDRDGWTDRNPVRYVLKVVPDRAPVARMELVGAGEIVTPFADIPVRLDFDDSYGLATVSLNVEKAGAAARQVPLAGVELPSRKLNVETGVALASFDATAGEQIRLWAEAADQDPRGPNVGRSAAVDLRVVTPEDFLAEMSRRELELRREFEQMLAAQRGLADSLDRLIAELPDGTAPPADQVQRLAALARQQSSAGLRVGELAQKFDHILAEMRVSKVARSEHEARIGQRLVTPLAALSREAIPAAVDAIAVLRQPSDADRRTACATAQAEVLRRMKAILANMLEWEGYQEAIALLRDLIAEQGKVREDTSRAVESRLDEILDQLGKPQPPPSDGKP